MKKFAKLFCFLTCLLFLTAAIPALTYSRQGILGGWRLATSGTYLAGAGMFDLTTANAFTGCADLSAYQDGKHLLWASDGTNTLLAWISATAPGGEALGANPAYLATLNLQDGNWFNNNSSITDANTFVSNGNGGPSRYSVLTVGALYKSNYVATGSKLIDVSSWNATLALNAGEDKYHTAAAAKIQLFDATAESVDVTSISIQRVTDCATTGALLLGSTGERGFISKSASFNPNAAGSYKVFKAY